MNAHRSPDSVSPPGRKFTMLLGIAAVAALSGCATTTAPGTVAAAPSQSAVAADLSQFCADAQARISDVKVSASNVVHTNYEAFVLSKPAVRPLETQQYAWYTQGAAPRLRMFSCKMKTADHIRTEYGADQSGDEGSCKRLHAQTLAAVIGGLSRLEKRRLKFDGGRNVVLDEDDINPNGPYWLAPYAIAYASADGRTLHLKSKGMRNDWLDPRLARAEARFKGTRYCHLIAPSYLRAILLGELDPETPLPPPAVPPDRSGAVPQAAVTPAGSR